MWIDIEQNTDEWLAARTGKLTGSAVAKVMANYGKAFGDPAKKLAADLAIQQVTNKLPNDEGYKNAHMERGHEQEPVARMLYEDEYFCTVGNGGFFDNGFTGCSPDGIVGKGIIEIKSVIGSTQYKTIKKGTYDSSYHWQIVFNIHETGADWLDYISYSSDFPIGKQLFVKRVIKDELSDEFKKLNERVSEFEALVESIKLDIIGFNR